MYNVSSFELLAVERVQLAHCHVLDVRESVAKKTKCVELFGAYIQLALAYRNLQNSTLADRYFVKALKAAPQNEPVDFIEKLFPDAGQTEETLFFLEKVSDLISKDSMGDDPFLIQHFVSLFERQGCPEGAFNLLVIAAKQFEKNKNHYFAADAYSLAAQKCCDAASADLEMLAGDQYLVAKGLHSLPYAITSYETAIAQYTTLGLAKETAIAYEKLAVAEEKLSLRLSQGAPFSLVLAGRHYAQAGRIEKAAGCFERAGLSAKQSRYSLSEVAEYYQQAAHFFAELPDHQSAERCYREASEMFLETYHQKEADNCLARASFHRSQN